ncbi:hypothetical protein G4B88_011892 [Cannabis sativa]|uniref:Uncharacterized protein n=1 Tax=Cannabis sativa TaxID=3483 RepID=A0A7J6HC43_CANSA|nr:hypothetical protein G4B88_011892 [Cannabis sativa]
MDGIIDTIFVVHPLMPLIGKSIMVGAPNKPLELPIFPLLLGRKIVAGSCTGGVKETQAMINFAAKQNITSHIELIPIHYKKEESIGSDDLRKIVS